MEKIILNEQEIRLIRQHLEDQGYFAKKGEMIMIVSRVLPPEDDEVMNSLVDKADAFAELDDYDGQMEEWNCDLLLWYYRQWTEQGNEDVIGLRKDR